MTRFFHHFGRFHAWVYRHWGALGRRLAWVPCLVLATTGRNSGQRRESVLAYADDGDDRIVVASNGGDDRAPGWLYNVRADPSVVVRVGGDRYPAAARIVDPTDHDYTRLWQLVNGVNRDRYERYQAKTTRPIALVVLSRTAEGSER
jgi:F420H(2)-dependent quinone reductase